MVRFLQRRGAREQRWAGRLRYWLIGIWRQVLSRRSQRGRVTWERVTRLARSLPTPRVLHPQPYARFAAKHPRQEPSAVIPLAGICAGGRP